MCLVCLQIYFAKELSVAFTLGEVLITLGIIGVVAAMTIPNLMSKIQKQIYVTSLKKNYAAMTQGFKMMLVEDEADDFGGSQYFIGMGKSACKVPADIDDDKCASLWAGLERHLKLTLQHQPKLQQEKGVQLVLWNVVG